MSYCSVPKALRFILPYESALVQLVCKEHDDKYAFGGTRRQRAIADAMFLVGLLGVDEFPVDRAHQYHQAVRIFGYPYWHGGYTDAPPESVPDYPEAP
jgi:hypothetical protein